MVCFIFALEFFTNMTGFSLLIIFDMTSFLCFLLSAVDNIFPQKDFSIILLNFIPAYLLSLKIIKSIFGIYIINHFFFWYIIVCAWCNFYRKILVAFKIKNPIVFFLSIFLVISTIP